MKSLLLIACMLALCSGFWATLHFSGVGEDYLNAVAVRAEPHGIITEKEAEIVMEYHGILSMKWSIPHKDFVFERDGEICRARAFEVIKERM